MIALHGACWLNVKTDSTVQARARAVIPFAALTYGLLFILAGIWLSTLGSYQIQGVIAHNGPSNPTLKHVLHVPMNWMSATAAGSWLWVAVGVALAGAMGTIMLRKTPVLGFLSSALVPISTITTAGLALFPFLMPSSSDPSASLTVWDASSSKLTLGIMLGAVVIFLPIIVAYTSWVYYVLRGPVRGNDITKNSKTAY